MWIPFGGRTSILLDPVYVLAKLFYKRHLMKKNGFGRMSIIYHPSKTAEQWSFINYNKPWLLATMKLEIVYIWQTYHFIFIPMQLIEYQYNLVQTPPNKNR